MRRASLILATRRPPFPLDNGARIRTHRLATGLAARFDVTLVTFAGGPTHDETTSTREDLEQVLPGVRLELLPFDGRAPGRMRKDALRPSSASWAPYASAGLRSRLRELAAGRADCVLHLDDPAMGLAGLGVSAGLVAFAPHNIEYRILRGVVPGLPLFERPLVALEWRKSRREERRLWRKADVCVAVSELDAETMRRGGARRAVVCPNGTDALAPPPPQALADGDPLRLLFVGSGAYWPYEQGLSWFVREVMPLVQRDGPVALDVVGERPRDPVEAPGVAYHGRVPEVLPYYERAHALVLPVFAGSGTRLKVLEAAALRRPVLSTALGVEGLPFRPGVEYVHAETPNEFAAACAELRSGLREARLGGLLGAAEDAARPFRWDRIADGLARTYTDELAARA
jgi:polysaccharide biosynthesis protein PslH